MCEGAISGWTPERERRVSEADDFGEIVKICLAVVRCHRHLIRGKVHEVCGPISNGGFYSQRTNLAVFGQVIEHLVASGHNVFDQRPLQTGFQRARDKWIKQNGKRPDYDPILELVYRPIFKSGLVQTLVFLPDWESSRGARWEMEFGKELGLEIVHFPRAKFDEIVSDLRSSRSDLCWPETA